MEIFQKEPVAGKYSESGLDLYLIKIHKKPKVEEMDNLRMIAVKGKGYGVGYNVWERA